jgi:hypothetical protein
MNKSEKAIVRTVAYLISTVISVSLLGLFSTWAWSQLDPAQQETIGAINTPWIAAHRDPPTASSEPSTMVADKTTGDGAVKTAVAHTPY